jgi:hypothetical protein
VRITAAIGLLVATSAAAQPFSDAEIRAILAHGPWPTPIVTDPSHRVSGTRAASN